MNGISYLFFSNLLHTFIGICFVYSHKKKFHMKFRDIELSLKYTQTFKKNIYCTMVYKKTEGHIKTIAFCTPKWPPIFFKTHQLFFLVIFAFNIKDEYTYLIIIVVTIIIDVSLWIWTQFEKKLQYIFHLMFLFLKLTLCQTHIYYTQWSLQSHFWNSQKMTTLAHCFEI